MSPEAPGGAQSISHFPTPSSRRRDAPFRDGMWRFMEVCMWDEAATQSMSGKLWSAGTGVTVAGIADMRHGTDALARVVTCRPSAV